MKKVLIVTPIFPPRTGGPATYVWELATRLKKRYHLSIICFSAQPHHISGVNIVALPESGISLSRQLNLFINVFNHSQKADLVYIQGPLVVGLTSVLAARLNRSKVLLNCVGDEVWETARLRGQTQLDLISFYQSQLEIIDRLKTLSQKISLTLSDFVVVPSRFLKDFLSQQHRLNPEKIHVIPNAATAPIANFRKKPLSLIFVGRLVPWKNIDQIIAAVALARRTKLWSLTIVGEGPGESQIKQTIKSSRSSAWIKFIGRLSHQDTKSYISQSQKLILYSDYEGLPHVLIEAMMLNTAIIASDIPSNREVTSNLATFVALNNIKALAQAINQPAHFRSQAEKFSRRRYTWRNHLSHLKQLI